jgi:hypothetical protein
MDVSIFLIQKFLKQKSNQNVLFIIIILGWFLKWRSKLLIDLIIFFLRIRRSPMLTIKSLSLFRKNFVYLLLADLQSLHGRSDFILLKYKILSCQKNWIKIFVLKWMYFASDKFPNCPRTILLGLTRDKMINEKYNANSKIVLKTWRSKIILIRNF